MLAVAALASLPGLSKADDNLVANSSFETGSFDGWTQSGSTAFNGVYCLDDGSAPDGLCRGYFGPLGTTGGIEQALTTVAGAQYLITFMLSGDGADPSSVQVSFGSQPLLTLANPSTSGFQLYSFVASASSASTVLSFQFRDDASFMELDQISVTAVPEPATVAMLALGIAVLAMRRRSFN
jgi:hypothetical protein